MIERPEITKWCFTRSSDGALYTKHRIIKSIIKETKSKGKFDATKMELGITGYEGVEEYDKVKITIRNSILQLRKGNNDKIIVITSNYNEYFITEEGMENWFEILKKARDHAKTAAAEAKLAQTLADEAEQRKIAAEQKVPGVLDSSYNVPEKAHQLNWTAAVQ